jgi:ATP-dependent RNA helicase DDX1
MGLAFSLVAKQEEKVWYHSCESRGKSCNNTRLKQDGGCCIWYNESQYMRDIEVCAALSLIYTVLICRGEQEKTKEKIGVLGPDLAVPKSVQDGCVVYGERKDAVENVELATHMRQISGAVSQLSSLETAVQQGFWNLRSFKW